MYIISIYIIIIVLLPGHGRAGCGHRRTSHAYGRATAVVKRHVLDHDARAVGVVVADHLRGVRVCHVHNILL